MCVCVCVCARVRMCVCCYFVIVCFLFFNKTNLILVRLWVIQLMLLVEE